MDVSHHFLLPTEKACVLCPDFSVPSIGPWLCSTPQVYSDVHWVEQFFFLNAHLLTPLENAMYPSSTSPEFLRAHKSILKLLNNPCLHSLQLLRHNTLPPYSSSFVLC